MFFTVHWNITLLQPCKARAPRLKFCRIEADSGGSPGEKCAKPSPKRSEHRIEKYVNRNE